MTAPAPVSYTVDPWDPGYGVAFSEELDGGALEESSAELNLDLETPSARWRPVDPDPAVVLPGTVLFLDGVRRIDARVWVHGTRPQPVPGIAASFAVGLVSCDGAARICDVAVERGLFTAAAEAAGITAGRVSYPARLAAGPAFEQLSLALQQRLTSAEVQLALTYRAQNPAADDLLVIDGPLRGRTHLDRAVGYIKTHHASYLPPEQAAVVSGLRPGQRTPAFTMGTSWRRTSWYLQLPRTSGVPWSGVVRLECSADLPLSEVTRLGGLTARLLPRWPARRTRIRAPRRTWCRSAAWSANYGTASAISTSSTALRGRHACEVRDQVTGNGGCHHQGVACSSMRSTHFTHQYPRRPGATRRSGYPWPADRGAPTTRVASSSRPTSLAGRRIQ